MEYLRERIDLLSELAEEFLSEIPSEYSHDELLEDDEAVNKYYLYEECVEFINAIRAEMSYGEPIEA